MHSSAWHAGVFGWRVLRAALLVLILLGLLALAAKGDAADDKGWQGYQSFLDVKRSEVQLRAAEAECERTRALFGQGLTSRWELDRDEAAVETARLEYQKALLDAYVLKPRVIVRRAVKLAQPDGSQRVRLTLENVTPSSGELDGSLVAPEDAQLLPLELREGTLRNVFISLEAAPTDGSQGSPAPGTTIALPYELLIHELKVGQPKVVELALLRDVTSIQVVMELRGARRAINIELEQELGGIEATLSSTHLSQEQELGGQADFRLELDRARPGAEASFWLRAINLPPSITSSFIDPGSGARLTQVRLPSGVRRQELDLTLYLPERAGNGLIIDESIPFWAVACDPDHRLKAGEGSEVSDEEIQTSGCAAVSLELLPRGRGRVEVEAAPLYFEIEKGEVVATTLTVTNTGSRRIVNVALDAEAPLNWQARLDPEAVPRLDVGHSVTITLEVQPPPEVPVGEYEVRVRPTSFVGNQPLATETKTFRIGVRSGTSLLRSIGLLCALLTVVGAVIYTAVRHSRR